MDEFIRSKYQTCRKCLYGNEEFDWELTGRTLSPRSHHLLRTAEKNYYIECRLNPEYTKRKLEDWCGQFKRRTLWEIK